MKKTDGVREKPLEIAALDSFSYNIDDVDGSLYMLERSFSGCFVLKFTKRLDEENGYGTVTVDGNLLPEGSIKSFPLFGGEQMAAVPVRAVFTEYGRDYLLHVEGFRAEDGTVMEPAEITVHTEEKKQPDSRYADNDRAALEAAREGIVLLKNEGHLLPLPAGSSLFLKGAEDFRISAVGAGKINPRYSIRLQSGIEDYSSFRILEDADTCIIVISRASGENYDNDAIQGGYYLTDEEEQNIAMLRRKYRKVIAVVNSGYPMDVRWIDTYRLDAALWCGYAGMCGGRALVEVLEGRVNPSGRLPDTWSLDYWDIPASANFYHAGTMEDALDADSSVYINTCYEEGIYVGYRYFETFKKPVAYPFGYGLSYTAFELDAQFTEGGVVMAKVENTGSTPGKEVVQIYASIPEGKLEQPALRLVGFAKTKELKPGEAQTLTLELNMEDFASYDEETARWIMEAGCYDIYNGTNVRNVQKCGSFMVGRDRVVKQSVPLMECPMELEVMSRRDFSFPKGRYSGIRRDASDIFPKSDRKHYPEPKREALMDSADRRPGTEVEPDFADSLNIEELARLNVCASHGWGMHETGVAGKVWRLEGYGMPAYEVADGNNGVNVKRKNIGMPCSNTVCASWNKELSYKVAAAIADEAKDNHVQMILGPGMNLHRNPLNGRHPEYFSEDPYLTGGMAGMFSRGLEENGISSCMKHVLANNCESSRKRNHSLIPQRAMRELYLKAFEKAISIHQPDSIMTSYNAVNGCYTAEDEELLQGIFRREFGFKGFVMTDWNSYDTVDAAAAVQAGNAWLTPGTTDDTFTKPIVDGVKSGKIDEERLRANIRSLLRVVQKRTGRIFTVKEKTYEYDY